MKQAAHYDRHVASAKGADNKCRSDVNSDKVPNHEDAIHHTKNCFSRENKGMFFSKMALERLCDQRKHHPNQGLCGSLTPSKEKVILDLDCKSFLKYLNRD